MKKPYIDDIRNAPDDSCTVARTVIGGEAWIKKLYVKFPWLYMQTKGEVKAKNNKDAKYEEVTTAMMQKEGTDLINFIHELIADQDRITIERVLNELDRLNYQCGKHKKLRAFLTNNTNDSA